MFIGVCRLEIWVQCSNSLKHKRRVVRSLVERLRQRHNFSVAEVDAHDLWQRAVIGVACVSSERNEVERMLSTLVEWVARQDDLELVAHDEQIY